MPCEALAVAVIWLLIALAAGGWIFLIVAVSGSPPRER